MPSELSALNGGKDIKAAVTSSFLVSTETGNSNSFFAAVCDALFAGDKVEDGRFFEASVFDEVEVSEEELNSVYKLSRAFSALNVGVNFSQCIWIVRRFVEKLELVSHFFLKGGCPSGKEESVYSPAKAKNEIVLFSAVDTEINLWSLL